jgi:hypothetical protein
LRLAVEDCGIIGGIVLRIREKDDGKILRNERADGQKNKKDKAAQPDHDETPSANFWSCFAD